MIKVANLINPQVMKDMISYQLADAMKFSPLCKIDNELVGQAGDTVTIPRFGYIGDASETTEGVAMDTYALTTSTETVTIKSIGKAVEISDKSVLVGKGNIINECTNQIRMAISNKIDNDALAELKTIGAGMTIGDGTASLSADLVADSLVKYGENVDGSKILLIAPAQLAGLRKSESWIKATDVGVNILMAGTVGMIHGCQVVLSNKIVTKTADAKTYYENFIVKPGALTIYMKRNVELETDRDILAKTTVVSADEYYVVDLSDASKAIKVLAKA
jgi:N4-gp56 family major capsid protein